VVTTDNFVVPDSVPLGDEAVMGAAAQALDQNIMHCMDSSDSEQSGFPVGRGSSVEVSGGEESLPKKFCSIESFKGASFGATT